MNNDEIHAHLAYIGKDRFQLTVTVASQPSKPMIEIMTSNNLRRAVRRMKPGAKTIRFVKLAIDGDEPLDAFREYFKKVYDSLIRAKASGIDVDAYLKEMERNPDPTDGTGNFSLEK